MVQSVLCLNGPAQTVLCLTHQISPAAQADLPPKRCRPWHAQTVPLTSDQQDLVVANMPFARWVAKRSGWHCGRETRRDLTQTANLALCRAAQHFDPNIGVPFAAYARSACERAVRDEMNERLGVVALPRWLFRKEGRGHVLQALVRPARYVAALSLANEPESAQALADDHLDAEAMLAWLAPDDRAILAAWLGGETMCHIAARLHRRRWSIGEAVSRILGELRARADG